MATLTNAKKGMVAKILAAVSVAAIVFVIGEFALAGPILFLVDFLDLGIGLGYLAFCLIWAALGLLALTLWNLFFSKRSSEGKKAERETKNWRERLVLWFSRLARSAGTFAAMILLGPIFAWPIFKLQGYSERTVYALTLISAWIFGVWVPIYAGAWDVSLSRLF